MEKLITPGINATSRTQEHCNFCKRTGHTEKACFKKNKDKLPVKAIFRNKLSTVKNIGVFSQLQQSVELQGKTFHFEVDTGAGDNFISEENWKQLGEPVLQSPDGSYESASRHSLTVLGKFTMNALPVNTSGKHHYTTSKPIQFVVSKVPDLNLLGRNAIQQLNISVDSLLNIGTVTSPNSVHAVFENLEPVHSLQQACKQLCQEFPDLFKYELGCLKDVELEIKFKADTRPVPFAIQEDLAFSYEAGIAKGVWKPTQFNSYGTPVVPVRKPIKPGQASPSIRVCGDYSVTVNPQLEMHRQPLPLPEDLMRRLGGGHGFTKIDLADAYNQIPLGPESQKKLALITHRGVLLQMRLPFGISSAPGYF